MGTRAITIKHWVLRQYLWLAVALLGAAFGAACLLPLDTWQERLGILAVPFVFLVAAQRQKTEELRLFKELFIGFNKRYDKMNGDLNNILSGNTETHLTQPEINLLFDYFNLCGEEYLFYRQGYIYPEVWEAWHNGMSIFHKNKRIKKLWDEDLETFSYYGFQWTETPRDWISAPSILLTCKALTQQN